MALGIGSRGYKDFGLSKSMTLPINNSAIEPDPKVMAQNAYMPGEGKPAKKKHATFALDAPPASESDKETVKRKKPSLFRRLFRRRRKTDRTEPYLVQPDDHDDEALVQVVRSQSDPDLSASKVSGEEGEGKSERRKGKGTKTSRQEKAKSTALEHITPVPVTAEQGTTGAKARGNGQHARRTTEKVEITASKQHTPQKAEQDVDEGEESEADHSTVKITSIDSESAQEDAATPRVVETEVKKRNGKKKKHISSTRASGGDFGPPLVASTPIKVEGPENGDKPRQRKKRLSTNAEESSATEDGSKLSKGSPRKKATGPGGKTGKEGKKIKKKTSTSAEESLTGNSIAKSPSKKSSEVSKSSISSGVASPEVKTVQVETNNVSSAENPFPASISVDEVDGSYEMERNARSRRSGSPKSRYSMGVQEGEDAVTTEKEKVKRKKSSKKVKGAEGEAENAAVGATKEKVKKKKSKHKESEKQKDAEKITVGVIAKEKADKKKPKSEDTDKKKKRKKSKEESSSRKTSRDQSQSPSRKASTTAKEDGSIEEMPMTKELPEEPLSLSVDVPPAQSAAISGSIESNTLTFVSTKKGSRSSLNQPGDDGEEEEEMERHTTNTLPRRKSADHSRRSSSSRDVSEFRNELREASRSQHDMPEAVNSSVTIDIDPNIKVKKSGLIKGKNLMRPSILDQSSSPEPEEVAPISSGPVEDNLLDSEFKVKKSGVVQGRKTSASTRPSILDEKEKEPTPVDIQRGEMKYNKKVIEDVDMDFSAIPETEPTLGVVAGRDRLDTANRSLIKRRPVSQKESLLLDSKEGKMMGTERVDLSQVKGGQNPRGSVGAAKQMFESSTKQDAASKYSARFSKLEKKPTNAASSTQQASVPAAEKKAPWARPAKGGETDTGKPSWVAMAQHKRSSYVETKETTTTTTTATPSKAPAPSRTPISSSSATKESSRPQLGTVAQRLAMFQKS